MCIIEEAYYRSLDAIMNNGKKEVSCFPALVSVQAQAWVTQYTF